MLNLGKYERFYPLENVIFVNDRRVGRNFARNLRKTQNP